MKRPLYWLIVLTLGWSAATVAAVPQDPAQVVPVAVGAPAPAFVAYEVTGKPYRFSTGKQRKPVLMIFYRGGWCPFCNAHLRDLQSIEPKLQALGYEVLFLSTDKPELLYASLKEKVSYHIVSDAGMNAARTMGVAFRVDDKSYAMMKSHGVDIEVTQGNTNHELPVPSVFIVDRKGIVRFRYFNPDYKSRLDAASVLKAAESAL
jgi:peroxiredoxin